MFIHAGPLFCVLLNYSHVVSMETKREGRHFALTSSLLRSTDVFEWNGFLWQSYYQAFDEICIRRYVNTA